MALLNVLKSGTYGIVSAALIDKTNRNVQFRFEVFADSSKTSLLFAREFFLACGAKYPKMILDRKQPNGSEVAGDYFFVPADATGEWAEFAGSFLQYLNNDRFKVEAPEGSMVQCAITNKIFRIGKNKELIEEVCGSLEIWEQFFAFEISTATGTNLIKQCYAYLKTTDVCAGALDS